MFYIIEKLEETTYTNLHTMLQQLFNFGHDKNGNSKDCKCIR